MNILFINTSKIWGGNEKWTHMAAHALAKNNNVYLAYRSEPFGSCFSVPKKKLPFLNRLDLFSLYRLVRFVKRQNIDILVSTNRKFFLLGALAARMTGCRHFVRCGIVWKVPDTKYYRLLFDKFIHGIIVNAKPIREGLIKSGFVDKHKIHLVYNGLDTKKLKNSKKQNIKKMFDFIVISSGELIPRKGYEFLIKSFAGFLKKKSGIDAGLVILGKGRQKKELEALAKNLSIKDRVIFTGFLENPYALLARADLFVSVSQNEGISNSMLEAMYLGIPVITTSVGGAGDVVQHGQNGYILEYGRKDELMLLIEQVYNEQEKYLNSIGEAAHRTVNANFSMEQMTRSLQMVFDYSVKRV
jgi:glycosyltransferase involved in cell wall biosynthesis